MHDATSTQGPTSDRDIPPTVVDETQNPPYSLKWSDASHGLIIVCDHAENTLPARYGTLGLPPSQLERHIGYDIGAKAVCEGLAERLDASLVMSHFSRLLIDPNRGIDDPTLIMRLSDGAVVPGNARHTPQERAERIARYYLPYDEAISRTIGHVEGATGKAPILLSIHSFTHNWRGVERPWHAGVLWDRDYRFARPLIDALSHDPKLVVGDNEPYTGELPGDTMNRHGTAKRLPHALLEIRQDLIADDQGVASWVDRLTPLVEKLIGDPTIRAELIIENGAVR